jgi:hypothetical protein
MKFAQKFNIGRKKQHCAEKRKNRGNGSAEKPAVQQIDVGFLIQKFDKHPERSLSE